MVERTLSMREAQGSIPCSSTFFFVREFFAKKNCANRESNPALKLGKLQCYRYTIGAAVANILTFVFDQRTRSPSKFGRVVKALPLGASLERGTGSNPVACNFLLDATYIGN
jgi:hypothetical protein